MRGAISDHPCECGCGGFTRLATQTALTLGHIRGQPLRFILGHRAGVRPKTRVVHDHPRAWRPHDMVPLRRLRVEALLGRYLRAQEFVYPMHGTLVVGRRGYLNLLKYRQRAKEATGDAGSLQCQFCNGWGRDVIRRKTWLAHLSCLRAYYAERERRKRLALLPPEWAAGRTKLTQARRILADLKRGDGA